MLDENFVLPICHILPGQYAKFKDLIRTRHKIDSIKYLRACNYARHPDGSLNAECSLGLLEAKKIVEHCLDGDFRYVCVSNPIKSIKVDMGDGEIELSLSDMSLRFIDGIENNTVDVRAVADLIRLYNLIKDWEDSINKR